MLEIERKFLAKVVLADMGGFFFRRRQQMYLSSRNPEVRVSRYMVDSADIIDMNTWTLKFPSTYKVAPDSYCMAVKKGSGLVRKEIEFGIPDLLGEELFNMVDAHDIIDKTRVEKDRWEIDVFGGLLSGLVLAEVELESEDEPLPPVPQGLILLKEVTGNSAYSNKNLINNFANAG